MSLFNKNCGENSFLSVFKAFLSQKQYFFALLGIFLFSQNLFAEGTKQLAPTSDDRVYIQPAPNGFGYYDGPEDLRLKINIANPNQEQVFLGFSRPTTSAVYPCSGSLRNAYFRIKDPNGNVVFPTPGSNNGQILDNANSNISTYAQAVAGPSPIAGGSGYTPYVFNPDGLPAGDYYIEFSTGMSAPGSSTVNIELFDITVATEGANPSPIDGRVHSQIWSMYAPRIQCNCGDPTYGCFDRPFNGKFNVYTPADSVVVEVDFANSGLQPAFFNVFFNSYGTANTGDVTIDRQSLNSQQVFATEYEIFLNDPDPSVYPSGTFGTYAEDPIYHTCNGMSGMNGAAAEFFATVTKPGQIEVLIDLHNTGDFLYTPNTADVILAIKIEPAAGQLPPYVGVLEWDGLDGLGNPVDLEMELTYRMKYSQAVVHFPIYDSEYMLNGFNVQTVRPTPPPSAFDVFLYYDDSNIPDATGNGSPKINLDGCTSPCHTWTNFNYGNVNTINTFFFGSEERIFTEEPSVCLAQAVDDVDSTTINVPVIIDVVDNDLGTDLDPTSVNTTGLMPPSNGTISINPITGEITYTPNPGFVGVDMFEYEICDANGMVCSTATVTVTVTEPTTETDCTDGIDNDGDGLIDCDDPDCENSTDCENPVIGIAKSNSSTVNNGDGTYTVSFLFTVENFGNVDLSDLAIFDDIVGQFAGMNPTNFATQNGTLTANTNWNGTSNSNILNANQTLAMGASGTVSISFDITPGATQTAENEATAEGTSPEGEVATDTSTDGTDPDGDDDDNDPDENTPTTVEFKEMPVIGVAKNNASTINNGDGTYNVSFDFVIENFGDVNLANLTLFDDIIGQFTGMNPTNFVAQNGTLTANTNWDGTAASNILNAGQSLNIGQSGTVSISFTVTPGSVTTVNNTAIAGGTTPAGITVNDISTTGTDPDGNDGDNTPDENDPTEVDFMENPSIGVAKNTAEVNNNGDGTYNVSFDFVIENFGDVDLMNITLFDDIIGQFTGMNPTDFMATSGTLTANNGWNGTATSNILTPGQSLNIGATGAVSVSFTITPGTATSIINTATGGGTTPAGNPVTDDSTSGTDPDGDDDDNDPDENTPTTVPFDENPSFTVVKADPTFVPVGGDIYTLTYEFTLENTGDIQLNNVEIFDDILNQFSNFNPTNLMATDGSFIANNTWNGNATSNILQNGQNLAVGAIGTVSISFDATLSNEETLTNVVNVSTTTPSGMVVPGNDTNVYEFTPPFCPELNLTLDDEEICGNDETNMAFTADANAGEIGIFYTIDNQLTANELYAAGHSGAILLTTVANSANAVNTVISSGALENNGTAAVTYYIYAILNDGNPNISPACNVVAMDEITVNPSPNATATTGGPYCEGENVQLFITGTQAGDSFLWTGPNGFSSTEQNPVIAAVTTDNDGDYSAVITNTFGCTFTTNTLEVVIDEMPAPATVSNNSPTCADGQNDVTLTATTSATGMINWYKDANTTPIGTGATLTLSNVTMADAGNYYAIIDNGLCPSAASATTEVIIDELPTNQTATTGDDMTVCSGESNVNLSANTPAIGTGMWSQNAANPAGAVIANPNDPNTTVTNLTAGTYIFTWSLSNGACENYSTDDLTITVSAALESPTISGDADVCEGETLTLMASNAPAGTTYEWTGPNGFTATTQTISINSVTTNNSGNYSVRLVNAEGCASPFSQPTTVSVFSQPATPIITGNEICDGENIELQTTSTGNVFEWFSPANTNTPAATTNTNSVSISSSNAGYQAGNWTVVVTDGNGCQSDISNPYNVVINPGPNAPTANYNDPVCEGQDLQLMATTIAGATYSWTGPNNYSSLEQNPTITNATMAAAGIYEVVAIVDGCASEAATINVTIGQNIIISPTNNGGACGNDLELYANASGGVGQLSYLWNGPNGFFSADENPVIPNPTAANEGVYTVMVMDDLGCSSEATLNVTLGGNTVFQPEISSNAPLCEGENLTLSTAQYSGQSVSYEWTGPNGTSTANGDYPNASTIIIENATSTNSGNYTVFVNVDGCGSNTSAPHSVTINNAPIANASTDFNGNCVDGQTDITLLANASNGNFPYAYVWNGPNGFTSNAANPTISDATAANSGTYTVRVTDGNGCQAEISTLNLTLENQPEIPMIDSPQMACFGEKVELTVTNADPSVTYSWTFNGAAIPNNNAPILTIDPASDADSGTYEVTASKADCTPMSATVDLTVSAAMTATVADQDFGCTDGATDVTIVSNVNGGIAPYTYAWTGPNGFTSTQAMPTIASANADDAGTYNVVVTDDNGCTSGLISAVISIKDALDQPVFEPLNDAPCEGEQVILEIQQYNGANVTYNWTFNGNALNNNSNILIINNATTANNGTYEVTVTADGCSTPANANFDLTVNEAIAATVANQNLTCIDNNTDLTLSANITSGTAPFSYEWSGPNGFTSNAASPVISNVNTENAGTYQVMITDNNGCQSAAVTAVIQITEAPDSPNLTSTGNVCAGGEVTLSTQSYTGSNVVYSWTKNGETITNNSNILNLNPATTDDAGDYVVSVSVDGCTAAPSNVVNVEIFDNPTITVASVDAQNCTDGTKSITLDATPAGGSGIYTYSWTGPNGFTSTDQDPVLNNINASMAGNYTVQIFDNNGCQGAAATVSVAITNAPDQPQLMSSSPNACEGDEVILSVAAATGANVSYTWSLNGTMFSNTANSLAINNVSANDAGEYEVTVTVDGCTATSEIFTQTVFAQPALTIFPINDLTCADGTTDITIQTEVSTGTAPYSFLWTGPNGFSSFEQNPTITGATSADAGNYQVTFEDANGCISVSESITINITDGIAQPTILTSNGAVCEGESLTLSVEPYAGANVSYQWSKDSNPIQNNDMPTLSFAAVSAADNGNYDLTVTVNGCANFANTFNLNINETPSVTAASSANGNNMECANGTQDIQLTATVTGGTAPYTYAWTGPNGFVSSLQNPMISGAMEADAGTYQVMITDANNCGSETASVELNITDGIAQPQIMANNTSGNTNTCEGEDLILTVDSYTGAMVTYAWTLNGAAIANNTNELTIQNAMAADAGDYEVTVTVDGCAATSAPFTVEIFGTPMVDIADLPDLICSNGSQNLTVDATVTNGSGNYAYAWTGPNGFQSENEDLNFQNATSEINGTYTLIATDVTGCVSESASVQVSVQDGINQPIVLATGPVCEGGTVTLEVTEYQGQSVNYEWTLNGETLPIEGHQYAIQNATIEDAGEYQVTVFVNNCSAVSEPFTLNIFASPTVSIAAVDEIPCADGTEDITLTTTVTGGIAPYVYAWEGPNGFTSTVASPTLSNVSSLQSGTYTVTVTDENNCGTDAVSIEVIIGNGIDQPIISSNTGNVCEGESTQLSVQNYTGSNVTFEWYLNNNLLSTNTNQHFINAATSADAGEYRVVVTVNDCEASSEEFTLEIFNSPQISIAAVAPIECSDGTLDVTLQTTISAGTAPFTYEWSGPNGFASTVQSPTLIDVTEADAGTYLVSVMDANNCAAATASVDVVISDGLNQPTITSSAASSCTGENVTLMVSEYAGSNVSYEWFFNGTSIGNNSNVLNIAGATSSNNGDYTVTVMVDGCSASSAAFTQTVFESATVTIDAVPNSGCTTGTDDITINSNVTGGTAPYAYSWTGPNGFVSTNADPTITGATSDDAGTYILTVTDANNCESAMVSVEVSITDGLDQPTISSTSSSACTGENVTLMVSEYAGSNVSYEWFFNGTSIGNNSNVLNIAGATSSNNGDYTVTVMVDGCSASSAAFTQTVFESATVTIDAVPNSGCTTGTNDITINSNVTSGTAPYAYSWTGPNGFVSTNADPTITGATSDDAGTYILTVTDANNCESAMVSVEVSITDGLDQPTISSTSSSACSGENVTLMVSEYAGSNVSYEWFFNGTSIGNNSNVLNIAGATSSNNGDYTVTVMVDGCSASSAAFTQTVFESATVTIDAVPNSGCTTGTDDITINSNVTGGTAPYAYSWTGPNGFVSTNADPTITGATSDDAGTYILTVTDANNCESAMVSVEVSITDGLDQPTISSTSSSACSGENVTLMVSEYAGSNVSYEWFFNGTSIGNNSNVLNIAGATSSNNGDYTVTVMVDGCSATSAAFTQTVFESATVTIDAVPNSGCTTGTDDITINSNVTGGTAPYAYSWTGPNGFVSTNADPTITGATSDDAGTYILTVTDANNCESAMVSVEVSITDGLDQPTISSTSASACPGENVTLMVSEYAGSNVSYEWFFNGTSIGNNSNVLNIAGATAADNGNYTVTVMVDGCSASSAAFTQTVFESATVTIDAVPNSGCTTGTDDITINSNVTGGTAPYTYSWTGPNGFVSTNADPTITGATSDDAGTYILTVTDANNCESAMVSVEVSITDGLDQPMITSATGPTCPGETVTLTVSEYAGSNVSYEWFFNGTSIGNNSHVLNIAAATPANSGDYSVLVNVDACSATSAAFTQTVFSQPSGTIADIAPVNCADGTTAATIDLTPQGGSGIYNYSWTGPNGFTSTMQDLVFNGVTSDDAGTYTVVITDANNCESAPASVVLEVNDSFEQPILTSTGATCEGGSATLSVDPVAGANVTYTWFKDGNLISNNGNELVLNSVNTSDAGDYQVEVTADGCSSTSGILTLEIFEKSEIIVDEVPAFACTDGTEDLTFNLAISGSQVPYTFSWTGPNGFVSTEFTPTIENVTAADAGTYIVQAIDGNGCATDPVSIAVEISDVLSQPSISSNGNAFCEGEEIMLSTTIYQGGNVIYNWTRDGVSLNINNPNLILNSATAADAGDYRVQVTVGDCSNTSAILAIEVQEKPIVVLDNAPTFACTDGTEDYTFSLAFSGDQVPYTFNWTGPNGFTSMEFAPTLENINESDAGTYTLIVTDVNGCASDPVSVNIDVNDNISQPTITSSGAACEGEQVTLSTSTYQGGNVTYNWTKDGSPLNINNPQIVINDASESDSGEYQVEVTVNDCSNTSAVVSVEVSEKPTVFFAPLSPINCADNNATVTLMPTIFGGSGGNTFAWTGPNGFTSTLQNPVIQATAANSGAYTVIVTSSAGCASDAESVEVLVTEAPDQPTISSNGAACEGEELILSTQAYQGSNVSYNWTLNGNPIANNSNELIIPSATAANSGQYAVTVTVDGCSNTSNGTLITVSENPTVEVTSSATAFCTSGMDSLTLFTNITGGVAPFSYEWVGPNGFFSVNANPVLQNVNDDMDGSYTVFITDGNGCASNAYTIEIDIEEGIAEPVITSTGQSCNGDEFTLSVPPYAGQNVTYEWSTPNGITANISGLNSNEIIINPTTAAHEGIYTITVTVDGCTNTSDGFNFMILDEPTANPSVATTAATCEGGNLELLSNATGNGTLTYEWSGPNGFTSSVPNPTINNVDDSYDGQYLLMVTNQQGCSTSATLEVDNVILPAPPTPTLIANAPICNGEDLILSTGTAGDMFAWVGPLGDDPATLQLPGLTTATGTTTILPSYEAYLAGNWGVRVQGTNGCWSEISAPVTVEINENPQAIATNGGAICAGDEAQLFANNITNATYEWYIAGENTIISTQANPVIGNVTEDTVFELLVTLNGCSSEAASTLVTVLTAPEAQPEAAYFLNSDCSPSDLQLTANMTTAGDFEFNWIGPNGFTSNLENPVIVNADEAANGVYELTITNGNGCSATYATNAVSVIPDEVAQPIISMSNPACEGETLILTTTQYEGTEVDYVWLLGTTIIASSNNNQFIINEVTADDEGDYSVNVQVDGCVLSSNLLTVNLLQQPEAAPTYVIGNGTCEGGTLQLFANVNNVSGNEIYEWTGPNGFTSNAPEPFISVTTVGNNGAYTVTVTNPNGCSTSQSVTVIEIGTVPATPVASSNSPVCEGGEIMLAVPQPAPGMPIYVWYNGLGQVIGNGQILTIMEDAPDAISPYSVKLVANGCESDLSDPISVTTETLATPMLSTDNDVLCEGQPLILNTTSAASNNATYTWFLDGDLQGTTTNPTYIVNPATSANSGIYTVQVNVPGCQSGLSNAINVSVFGATTTPTTANSTNANSPACNGSVVMLTTPFISGATYTWYGPNGYTSTNFSPVLPEVTATDAGDYFVVVEVEGCASAVSETTTVYVQPVLPTIMVDNDGPYCVGDSATLSILNPISLSPADTVTYEWFNAETMASIGTTDTTFIGIANLDATATGNYYVVMTLNGCEATASDSTFVNVAELPQNGTADAGEDVSLCASTEAALNATLPVNATGMWTSPTGATIENPTAANTMISDLQIGDNVFIWTLSQGGCGEYAADTVVYAVALIPEDFANAGPDENLCGRSTINLNASIPTQATGTWTQPMGQIDAGITIVEANNPSTAITDLTPGEYEFYWSLSEGGCENYSIDTVIINIMDGPMNNAYIAKDEFFACGQEEFTLVAETPSEGTGIWTSNTGALIVNPTSPSTLVADLAVGENWFYWSLSTPGCENYSVDSALIVVHDDLQGVEDMYEIAFNESLENFDVLENDIFGNVDNYSFEVLTRPSHGALVPLNDEGVFDYVPNANFFGFDTMQYVICNLDCPNACDTVTVSFLIGGTSSADDCFAPNLITPNGDGMNDALMFPCIAGGNFPDNNIMIFNRWGDKVYETAPYNNDWMGTYKGQPLPAGSYYYILMLEEGETPLTGFFTIVR